MDTKYKSKLFTLIGIVLGLVLVLGLVAAEISKTAKTIQTQQKTLAKLQLELVSLNKLQEAKTEYAKELAVIAKSLPASYQDVANYTQWLESLAKQSNQVLETTIDRKLNPETSGLSSLKYAIKTTGNLIDFNQLISTLTQLPYHTKIDSVKLQNDNGQATTVTTYRIYMIDQVPQNSQNVPNLDINSIKAVANELENSRLKGGE